MFWRAASLAIVSIALAACGGGDDDAESTVDVVASAEVATANPGETRSVATVAPTPTPGLNADKDKDDALKALERQIKYLTDGQATRAYEEIHPAQRALFTREQYTKCTADADSVGDVKLKLKEAYIVKDMQIPGTEVRLDALALTVELTMGGRTDTTTFHEFRVDGKWVFVASDPDEIVKGTC